MVHLGTVRPGSTVYVPFETFAASTGAPITITNLATSDILVYKAGSTTQRASASGFTLLDTDGIDFDATTGIHGFSIDLADNTTAGFWSAGSSYFIVVSPITVDGVTMSFLAASFTIGQPGALLDTTIATLASQTSFTLTSGPAEDDALNGSVLVVHDVASAVQQCQVVVLDYTGATKTVTLAAAGTFTIAATDNVSVYPKTNVAALGGTNYTAGAIPAAVAGSAGGLVVLGANTASVFSVTCSAGPGLKLEGGSDQHGLHLVAGGSLDPRHGLYAVGNAGGGNGAKFEGGAGGGAGLHTVGSGAGSGILAERGGTGVSQDILLLNSNSQSMADAMWGAPWAAYTAATTTFGYLQTAVGVRAAVGLASANLDTQLAAIAAYIDTEVAAIKTVTDQFTAAQTEPTAVPAANATPLQKIAWLGVLARNLITQTATTQTLKADNGTTTIATSTVSDDGTTFSRGEWQ